MRWEYKADISGLLMFDSDCIASVIIPCSGLPLERFSDDIELCLLDGGGL